WDGFVRSHSAGSAFHLTAWQELIRETFGHQPLHLMATTPTGVVGVLPLFLVRSRIFGRLLVSTPLAAYGGILTNAAPVSQAIFERALVLAKELKVQFVELRNFRNALPVDSLLNKDLYVTFRTELHEDAEANMLGIPRKTRAEIREGIRNHLEFRADAIGPA